MRTTSFHERGSGSLAAILLSAAAAFPGDVAPPAGAPSPGGEGLAVLLAAAADAEARSAILRQFEEGAVVCPTLAGFGPHADPAVREQAVRSMDQAGCAAIEYYRPYMGDANGWVTDALVAAIERHGIGEGIPFLIRLLPDPRNIVSGGGVWTIGERAHRALRAVSCQSMHYDPGAPPQERARAAARWTTWYAEHGGEPRASWLESGLERASAYLESDAGHLRREGLELLLLIGTPAAAALQAAFRHDPADLESSLTCTPDEPPRVTEEVPCRFEVSNRSDRRIALIPGELGVALRRQGAGEEDQQSAVYSTLMTGPPQDGEPMTAWIDRIVDLAPGQRLGWPVRIGPVSTAGRYDVLGRLTDLTARIAGAGKGEGTAIEARTTVRFGQ